MLSCETLNSLLGNFDDCTLERCKLIVKELDVSSEAEAVDIAIRQSAVIAIGRTE